MPRFLIAVAHNNTKADCDLAVNIFKATGSHFLTNADFGCEDDAHYSWMTVDVKSKSEALNIVPHPYRDKTKVIKVKKFALEKLDKTLKPHHK